VTASAGPRSEPWRDISYPSGAAGVRIGEKGASGRATNAWPDREIGVQSRGGLPDPDRRQLVRCAGSGGGTGCDETSAVGAQDADGHDYYSAGGSARSGGDARVRARPYTIWCRRGRAR
jgi:hypothetical protein